MTENSLLVKHWQIPVVYVGEWRYLEVTPDLLRDGDLWLDPHGDELRGVVESVRQSENSFQYLMKCYGQDIDWHMGKRVPVRIVRPTKDDDG